MNQFISKCSISEITKNYVTQIVFLDYYLENKEQLNENKFKDCCKLSLMCPEFSKHCVADYYLLSLYEEIQQ